MLNKSFVTLLLIIVLSSCHEGSSTVFNQPKSSEELRAELGQQEQADPTRYLTAEKSTMKANKKMTRRAGLFRDAEYAIDGYIVDGVIRNTASIAKFKDAIVTISFVSQTGTVIKSLDYTIYEFFGPNSSVYFSFKTDRPEATENFYVQVKDAVSVN